MRHYTFLDQVLMTVDSVLQTATGQRLSKRRDNPANHLPEPQLTEKEKKHVGGLMRVNHVGEVCAQALYQGQALTAKTKVIQQKLEHAAEEELDHLTWCNERLAELNSHTSYLNPIWYIGSLAIGAMAGLVGDKFNLGFLVETERQVEQHLTNHLAQLPSNDIKSRCILEQMRIDEVKHALTAEQAGAAELPMPVKLAMRCFSKVMTTTAYWI